MRTRTLALKFCRAIALPAIVSLGIIQHALATPGTLIQPTQDGMVTLRNAPSAQADTRAVGFPGDAVEILREQQGQDGSLWYYVRFRITTAEGWVPSRVVRRDSSRSRSPVAAQAVPQPETTASAQRTIAQAQTASVSVAPSRRQTPRPQPGPTPAASPDSRQPTLPSLQQPNSISANGYSAADDRSVPQNQPLGAAGEPLEAGSTSDVALDSATGGESNRCSQNANYAQLTPTERDRADEIYNACMSGQPLATNREEAQQNSRNYGGLSSGRTVAPESDPAIASSSPVALSFDVPTSRSRTSNVPTPNPQPGPRPVAVGGQQVVEYFLEIALGSEWNNTNPVIKKWRSGEVRVRIIGNPTQQDRATLQGVINELNELTNGAIRLRIANDADAQIEIHFIHSSRFRNFISGDMGFLDGFVRTTWSNDTITAATVLIATDTNPRTRASVIREELTQSLGLMQDSFRYSDSIFYQDWNEVNQFSRIDREVIRLLYRPEIQSGMDRDQLEQMLQTMLN